VSNIIRRHIDNRKLLLICILLLADSFIFFKFYFYQYIVVFLFNTVIYAFLLLGLCILIVQLPWLRFSRDFSSVVRQMPGYNSPRRGTARTVPITFWCCSIYCFLCCSMYFCFLSLCVLFLCICVLYYCHRVSTQLQLTNISYHIIPYHLVWKLSNQYLKIFPNYSGSQCEATYATLQIIRNFFLEVLRKSSCRGSDPPFLKKKHNFYTPILSLEIPYINRV
jgi:hypothetical protein